MGVGSYAFPVVIAFVSGMCTRSPDRRLGIARSFVLVALWPKIIGLGFAYLLKSSFILEKISKVTLLIFRGLTGRGVLCLFPFPPEVYFFLDVASFFGYIIGPCF